MTSVMVERVCPAIVGTCLKEGGGGGGGGGRSY